MTPEEMVAQQQALIASQGEQIKALLAQLEARKPELPKPQCVGLDDAGQPLVETPPVVPVGTHTENFAKAAHSLMNVIVVGLIIIIIIGTLMMIAKEM
jgi:hypothetical protein